MDSPRISVIIPIFNGEKYIAESIESAFGQSSQAFEIIVVDDGSVDQSGIIAQTFTPEVTYYYQPNAGIAAARNKGIEKASGDYLWTNDKLSLQIAAFKADLSLDIWSNL
jgi:glycosyltransferase involved in cell wall biosynthesis